ncbi:hypothetical protein FQA39_LY06104 [Lamprigera yunnana]|nr:hypothetical protein FQA39_LY06104 [Lamprigera yunnana]
MIAPFVDEYAGNVFISGINNASSISGIEMNDELWMAERHWLQHLNKVVKDNDGQLQETPVTYSGFSSHDQNSKDVRPRSTVKVFPILYQKSVTMAMQKHCMHIAMKEHQESSNAEQTKFLKHLKAHLNVVQNETIVNPFKKTGMELVILDAGEVMNHVNARCLKEAKNIGQNHV